MIILFEFRGVFQSLIEKHFPAPDTQKTLDIFGLKDKQNSIFDDIDLNNILTRTREKRKGTVAFLTISHRLLWTEEVGLSYQYTSVQVQELRTIGAVVLYLI